MSVKSEPAKIVPGDDAKANESLRHRQYQFWLGAALLNAVAMLMVFAWPGGGSQVAVVGSSVFWLWIWALRAWDPKAIFSADMLVFAGFGVVLSVGGPAALGAYAVAAGIFAGVAGAAVAVALFRRWNAVAQKVSPERNA